MARARKSLDEHKLNSTKPQYVEPDVLIAPGRPKYPRGITPEAKRVFKNVCRLLERRRSLTEADGELIRLLALAHVRHSKAIEKLVAQGEIKTYYRLDKHGEQVPTEHENLWLPVAQSAEKLMIGIYDRLGLTPLNRGKVKPATEKKAEVPEMPTREETTLPEAEIDLNSINENLIN